MTNPTKPTREHKYVRYNPPQVGVIYGVGNMTSRRWYVGQTKSPAFRKSTHFQLLKKGMHCNKELQADYNKHGRQAFCFSTLTTCSFPNQEKMDSLEAEWIIELEKTGWNRCYNRTTGGTTGFQYRGVMR
jgi:hypothetical protein